jgi:hypothetical protein
MKIVFALLFLGLLGYASCGCDLTVGTFAKTVQWALADQYGWFAPSTICGATVTGSVAQFANLNSGLYDAISTTHDNIVNRVLNHNTVDATTLIASQDYAAAQIVLGAHGITSISQLKGKNIAVDSATSGFVMQFRAIAADYGLYYEKGDFTFIPVGATYLRYTAMQKGNYTWNGVVYDLHATVLQTPQSVTWEYEQETFSTPVTQIAALRDFVAPIMGNVVAVKPATLTNATKVSHLQNFLKGMMIGQKFFKNPANSAAVIDSLAVALASQRVTPESAVGMYEQLSYGIDGTNQITDGLDIPQLANLNVAYIRQRFNGFPTQYPDFSPLLTTGPDGLVDYTIRDSALAAVQAALAVDTSAVPAYITFKYDKSESYTVYGAVAAVQAKLLGGCISSPVVQLVSCTPASVLSAPIECQYKAADDTLHVNPVEGKKNNNVYIITYSIQDQCGYTGTATQTLVTLKKN